MRKKTKIVVNSADISIGDYAKILKEIQSCISQTQNKIIQNVARQKVEMAWQIGKTIEKFLSKKDRAKYGERLITKLEADTAITKTVLYKMHGFYKTYPKIPKDDPRLNWSHYRILSGVKKIEERKFLEDLTRQNSWEVSELQQEVKKNKVSQSLENKDSKQMSKKNTQSKNPLAKNPLAKNPPERKITPTRGKLFSYEIKKIVGSEKYFFDCGFGIFREISEILPRTIRRDGVVANVTKKNGVYSIKKSAIPPQKLHTYKAHLERVVDGDTIRVNLDLGFGIFHHEILRLAKINAPEIKTNEGKKSFVILKKILKDVPFLIVKSIKTDIYGRYVADVFLAKKEQKKTLLLTAENELQNVAESGEYLNQKILNEDPASLIF
ncbi:MAG: hypothetical protein KGP29_00150 [Proteobacteria bacterium]|nr:hypothetical protein [Pseudomonadota bacterium]